MRLRLDRDKCGAHGQCHAIDPDLFPLDDDGFSALELHEVAPGDEKIVRDGVAVCPEVALIIEQS